MKKQSWISTFVTQVSLCLLLFLVLNIGQPQKSSVFDGRSDGRSNDMYFVSVSGGSRPLQEQSLLLKQIEKVVKRFKAQFVINISHLEEDDPVEQNGSWYSPPPKVSWYTTRSEFEGVDHYLRQIKTPCGRALDVIVLNTSMILNSSNGSGSAQLQWLTKTLKESTSDWHIVVGFHALGPCDEKVKLKEENQHLEPFHQILLRFGVDAYLSGQACNYDVQKEDADYMKKPVSLYKGSSFTSNNQKSLQKGKVNGFLLHRVSCLDLETYFVPLEGEIMQKVSLKQRGKDVM